MGNYTTVFFSLMFRWKTETLPLVITKPYPQLMIKHDAFVSSTGYPPLTPVSFKPQSARHQGIAAVHYQVALHASTILLHQCKKILQKAVNNL